MSVCNAYFYVYARKYHNFKEGLLLGVNEVESPISPSKIKNNSGQVSLIMVVIIIDNHFLNKQKFNSNKFV